MNKKKSCEMLHCRNDTFFTTQSTYKRTNTEKVLKDMGGTYPVVTKSLFTHWLRLMAQNNFTGIPTSTPFVKFLI